MKNRSRLFAILLSLCLLAFLAGCNGDAPQQTTVTPTTTTPTTVPTTTSPPDAQALYAEAVQAMPSDVTMEAVISSEVRIADAVFTASSELEITYLGLGTEDFLAKTEEDALYGDYEVEFTEVFADGMVYATICDVDFSSEMTQEDFVARYLPTVLLDASLYATVTMDGNTITFRDPTALESWLLDEEVEITEAYGTATLENGTISEAAYTATYILGGSAITVSVEQTLAAEDGTSISVPTDTEAYTAVESIDAPKLLDQAFGYLQTTGNVSAGSIESIFSQAAGVVVNFQMQMDAYRTGDSPMIQLDQSIYQMDYSRNESISTEIVELYRDGKFTTTTDDERPVTNSAITLEDVETYCLNFLTENVLNTGYLNAADITDTGSIYLAEFTGTEELGHIFCDDICYRLFGNASLLSDMASAYRTDRMDYYLSIDKYTGLPIAMGLAYEGCHTIDGMEYPLTYQIDYTFDLAGLGAYHAITEELLPEEEPENKATPLFYHVTGPDGQEMWLFGTIHVGDARTGFLPQEIYDALLASDALAVECDTEGFEEALEEDEELQSQVSGYYYYSDGTISDHLDTEDLYEDALKVMKATGSYFYNSDYQKASLWSNSIDIYYLNQGRSLDSEKGMESRLEKIAEENDIPLWEVESSLFQVQMLTGYSDYLQEFQLYSSVYSHGKDVWEGTQELYELWCSGDEEALIEEMARETWQFTEEDLAKWEAEEDLDEEELARIQNIRDNLDTLNAELEKIYQEYTAAMEIDRNAGMLDVAKQYLESGDTVFYAVGLAHLLAEDGLVFTLRDAGYTVELVEYN